jgi:hypothetical protein
MYPLGSIGGSAIARRDVIAINETRRLRMPDPKYPLDQMNKADGLDLLRGTPDNYSKMIIFDPQYREVLDQLKYGNEGDRQKG